MASSPRNSFVPSCRPSQGEGAERGLALQLVTGSGEGQDALDDRLLMWERDGSPNQTLGVPSASPKRLSGSSPMRSAGDGRCAGFSISGSQLDDEFDPAPPYPVAKN